MLQFDNKVALITGSTQGIGRATALEIGRRGGSVTVNYPFESDRPDAERVVAEIEADGGRAIAVQADVTDLAAIRRLFDETEAAFGGLDFVVSNAGGTPGFVPIADCSEAMFDAAFGLNAKATFFVLQEAARRVRDQGRIVGLSSSTTRLVYGGTAHYAGAKAAVELYCKVLSKEIGARGITVNSLSPGMTDTEGMRAANPPPERLEIVRNLTPLGRIGQAEDVARAIVMLLGEDARWITGQHINAGGGAFH